jgi:hypothetical protein
MEVLVFRAVSEPGWDDLHPRVLRPSRPRLQPVIETSLAFLREDAKRVAAHADDVREPQTRLRGEALKALVERNARHTALTRSVSDRAMAAPDAWLRLAPKEWLADENRLLVGDQLPRGAPPTHTPPPATPTLRVSWTQWATVREAPTLDYVLALCTDPDGVVTAEALAREACRRMSPFGVPMPVTVLWTVEHQVRRHDYIGASPFRERATAALRLTEAELAQGEAVLEARDPPPDAWRAEWLRRAKRDLTRRNAWSRTQPPSRENPFEPIVEIWRRGYALVAVLDEWLVLAATAPAIEELVWGLA